jgi:hypothetical protein
MSTSTKEHLYSVRVRLSSSMETSRSTLKYSEAGIAVAYVCIRYGERKKFMQNFGLKILREKNILERMLKWVLQNLYVRPRAWRKAEFKVSQ